MRYTLPPLPDAVNALEPYVSAATMHDHRVLHQGYIDKLNRGARNSFARGGNVMHTLLWPSMSPHGGGAPSGELARRIERDFGSYAKFHGEFISTAKGIEGSGWCVLANGRRLRIVVAHNHWTPAIWPRVLLGVDAWEHAWYLDHGPDKGVWYDVFFERLVDWREIGRRL